MLTLSLLIAVKIVSTVSTPVGADPGPRLGGPVSWQPSCEPFVTDYDSNRHPAAECGIYVVPRDYHDSSAGTFTLAVARRNATVEPRLGTIFVNPGGPGLSGVQNVWDDGDLYLEFTGGQHDIVAYDQRGAGLLWSLGDCMNGGKYYGNSTILANQGLDAYGNFTNVHHTDPNELAFWLRLNQTDEDIKGVGTLCLEMNGANLTYVGTAAAVRDMISLSETLEGADVPVNYWGISYGTVVGSFFLNMFPERAGRVILDGVVNPIHWASEPQYQLWGYQIQNSPKTYDGFINSWAQSNDLPPGIKHTDHTEADLKLWVQNLVNMAFTKHATDPDVVSSGTLRSLIFGYLYHVYNWVSDVGDLIAYHESLNGNGTKPVSAVTSFHYAPGRWGSRRSPGSSQHLGKRDNGITPFSPTSIAIACSDSVDAGNTTTRDIFNEVVNSASNVFQLDGTVWDFSYYCHHWPARAVERYTGPWNANLSQPALVIGNTIDPITPLVAAQTVVDMLGDSAVLLVRDGLGHTSWSNNSTCTNAVVAAYYVNGTLPTPGTVCATDPNAFGVPGISNSSSSSTVLSSSSSTSHFSVSTSKRSF